MRSVLSFEEKSPLLFVPLPYYKRGICFLSFFLSNAGFVSHHYYSFVEASICHLSCCYFSKIGHLTSHTELINDDIIVVMSFHLTLSRLRL